MTLKNANTLESPATLSAAQSEAARQLATNNNKLLLTLWLVVESVLFACLIYANFSVRFAQGQWPPAGVDRLSMTLPLMLTAVLLVSSVAAIRAVTAIRQGQLANYGRMMIGTIVLGIAFVIGVFSLLSRVPYHGVYDAMFFTLWIVHVAHAIAVLGFLGYVGWRGAHGSYPADRLFPVEAATYLWHFLDIMWIVLFVVLYLV
jgi:heme/copper-type cytochrome/quinol oxidase subunit 3